MNNPLHKKLSSKTTAQLVELFNYTERMAITTELAEVRGAIMDSLEARDHVAFDAWMDDPQAPAPDKYFN